MTIYENMQILRKDIMVGRSLPEGDGCLWGGADLIVTDVPLERETNKVVVLSPHAEEISRLVYALRDIGREVIDSLNRFVFYPALGEAANRAMTRFDASCRDILFAMLDAADGFFAEFDAAGYAAEPKRHS